MDIRVYISFAIILYGIGIYCLLSKRNLIRILIGLEILANAANLNFIAFSTVKAPGLIDPLPHVFVIVAIVIHGCIIAIGLTLVVMIYRIYHSLDVKKLKRLRW
ncbi:MAG: NADH-quinone oxidoreductase subunit NuoK [Candidatus Baldrarchaeia archaeon]